MRNNMIVTLQEDFVELAKAKGLHERRIITSYAGRNAILPSMTSLAMYFGIVMGGSLLVEMVFSYPGIGMMLYQAVIYLDYPLMQAIFLIIAFTVMTANFIVEIIYAKLDPRIGARR
jgi:peptide/nickel transport system permease protein